ncbi:HAMP domain-containing sensor histidine kinase [Kordiimonas sp. SCSIO 12610]|uniref:sensor histidine kinase n=1 Tax=Kordiimonas sp. SCSIO 12610 TaxID=2829597 RepID=UPI00210C22DB|nr:HAMP domain-containing sensor histidine kinase [Kordiimonas sp. SCSIO 12610]UTW55712.1 HAMP domain-containing histidine kinase [Kordiimonas sp. SCSIO 12610]
MKKRTRRVRGMIMRTFLSAIIVNFIIFSLIAVVFSFSLEDEIFDLQVREAVTQLTANEQALNAQSGSFQSLAMEYYIGQETLPDWLKTHIDPRYQDQSFEVFAKDRGHFHAYAHTLSDGQTLYVMFNARRFIRSTPQIKTFLMVIAALAGIAAIISFFVLNRMSKKVSTPLEQMASAFETDSSDKIGKKAKDLTSGIIGEMHLPEYAPRELQSLYRAIEARNAHIQALLERERQFNRDASHELRTPLAVAIGAVELMEENESDSPTFRRLKTSMLDMQQLTEGILWLGRAPEAFTPCSLKDIWHENVESYQHLVGHRDIEISFEGVPAHFPVPEPVAHVIVGNLLRNALSYTDRGLVMLRMHSGSFEILDTGVGYGNSDPDREGFGVGLSLVRRLCEHFDIAFELLSRDEGGTIAKLSWGSDI